MDERLHWKAKTGMKVFLEHGQVALQIGGHSVSWPWLEEMEVSQDLICLSKPDETSLATFEISCISPTKDLIKLREESAHLFFLGTGASSDEVSSTDSSLEPLSSANSALTTKSSSLTKVTSSDGFSWDQSLGEETSEGPCTLEGLLIEWLLPLHDILQGHKIDQEKWRQKKKH